MTIKRWPLALGAAAISGLVGGCGKEEPVPNQTCEDRARLVGRAFDEDGTERFPSFLVQAFSIFWNMEYDRDGVTIVEGFYPVSLRIPEDVTSIGITLQVEEGSAIFMEARANDEVLFAISPTMVPKTKANVAWPETVSIVLPNNEHTDISGKCVDIWVAAADVDPEDPAIMLVTSRRGVGKQLNLNFIVDEALDVSDATLVEVAERASHLLQEAFQIGEVTFERAPLGDSLNPLDSLENALGDLREEHDDRLNIVVVETLLLDEEDDTRARFFVPGTPGTPISGTEASFVRIALSEHFTADGADVHTEFMGDTLAHAIGKMFGLFHTSEPKGNDVDPIDDTPKCLLREKDFDRDGFVSGKECESLDGTNLMFWSWVPGVNLTLTETQIRVLKNHPLVLADGEVR